jgi:VWFA-related protein
MFARIALCAALLPALLVASFDSHSLGFAARTFAQDRQPELPRFRAGTNLVRVDAYVSKDDVAVEDLKVEDFVVYEDDRLQNVESFQLIKARPPIPQSERRNPTNVRDMQQDVADAARVFTLFLDNLFVSIEGSYQARRPIIETLDRVIGEDDLVGVMTPETPVSAITYSRKTTSIENAVTKNWHWGQRDRLTQLTPQEELINQCFNPNGPEGDIAEKLIARLREQQTLRALESLVTHLDGLRPERKFVMVFTEGWNLFRIDESLARRVDGRVPGNDPVGTDPRTGGLSRPGSQDPRTGASGTIESCDRLRTMLAYIDHEVEFRELLQRANRANVSFYPIDARGLITFDTTIQRAIPPFADAAMLRKRHDDLRMMADQTDGHAVLNTGSVSQSMQKIFADAGSYYLLSYYSTNQKLDGRFRRIRVEVKRDGLNVRARPGYLAPTEAEARSAGAVTTTAAAGNIPPPTVTRALDALAPARGNMPVRVQAAGAPGTIRAVVELDPATAKQPEWLSGGTLKMTFEPERAPGAAQSGAAYTVTLPIEPGQRSIPIDGTEQPLPAGRYSVRAELTARNSRLPLQVTTFATVPADNVVVGTGALALRRGPSTGLAYIATADPRFRRTERLRIEVPIAGEGFIGTGRLLTREGKPLEVVVNYSTRAGAKGQLAVAEVALAPLAAGEYVLELALARDGKTELVSYGFRIVP